MADIERSAAAAPARNEEARGGELDSLPGLFGRLGDDVMQLLDTKLTLLKVEVKEETEAYVRGAVMIGVGAVIALVGFALLNVAVAFGISALLADTALSQPAKYAVGFLITSVVYLVVGGILIVVMKNRLAKRDMMPERSVEELRKDKQWLKK
ncbi:MAG TPA: phage holin family protein, partial [Pyrinomonadaceae bacterium]